MINNIKTTKGEGTMVHTTTYEYTLSRRKTSFVCEDGLTTPQLAFNFLSTLGTNDTEQEHFITLMLNVKNQIKGYYIVSIGFLTSASVHPREVFRRAVIDGADRIIIAHNHPSGILNPSADDIRLTQKIKEAGDILDISLVDHIVYSDNDWFSFQKEGML